MRRYGHLSVAERDRVAGMRVAGAGVGEIAREVGRSASTVSREHARNGPGGPLRRHRRPAGQRAPQARLQAAPPVRRPGAGRAGCARRSPRGCWSPEQVDGRLRLEVGR